MKIGIIGTRGIPNAYGGFEQFAERFSQFAAEAGNEMWVYCSSLHSYQEKKLGAVNLIHCHDPEDKLGTIGQFLYDRNCILDAQNRRFDILLILGYTSSSIWMHLLPKNTICISNMDGLEWKRSKYNFAVKLFLKKAEAWAAKKSHYLIADSPAIQAYLFSKYQLPSTYIAYGADIPQYVNTEILNTYNIKSEAYSLLIARAEPENNIHIVCDAYSKSVISSPLLIIGNFENTAYGRKLKQTYASEKIRFIGGIYEIEVLDTLRYHSCYYFHGHSVGGTNPSLLEAMASRAFIIAHDNPFNRAVLQDDALYFEDAKKLLGLLNLRPKKSKNIAFLNKNLEKIKEHYSWKSITHQLLDFFTQCLKNESINNT